MEYIFLGGKFLELESLKDNVIVDWYYLEILGGLFFIFFVFGFLGVK